MQPKPKAGSSKGLTVQAVRQIGNTLIAVHDEARRVATHVIEKSGKPIAQAIKTLAEYAEAAAQAGAAEREALIMQRALEIKKAHPKVPGPKAIQQARNELAAARK